jgi:hypothetical protein
VDHKPPHSAAWWGIVEPTLGVGKFKCQSQQATSLPDTLIHRSAGSGESKDLGKGSSGPSDHGVVHRQANASTSRGRDTDAFSPSGHRGERSGLPRTEHRLPNHDRSPMKSDTRQFDRGRDQQQGKASSGRTNEMRARNGHEASASRNR